MFSENVEKLVKSEWKTLRSNFEILVITLIFVLKCTLMDFCPEATYFPTLFSINKYFQPDFTKKNISSISMNLFLLQFLNLFSMEPNFWVTIKIV